MEPSRRERASERRRTCSSEDCRKVKSDGQSGKGQSLVSSGLQHFSSRTEVTSGWSVDLAKAKGGRTNSSGRQPGCCRSSRQAAAAWSSLRPALCPCGSLAGRTLDWMLLLSSALRLVGERSGRRLAEEAAALAGAARRVRAEAEPWRGPAGGGAREGRLSSRGREARMPGLGARRFGCE